METSYPKIYPKLVYIRWFPVAACHPFISQLCVAQSVYYMYIINVFNAFL